MALTKAELTDGLSIKCKLSRQDAKEIVDNFFNEIVNTLVSGEDVKLSGFGNFSVRDKNERPGRNLRTGEDVIISKRRVVTFKQGQKLKDTLANSKLTTTLSELEVAD